MFLTDILFSALALDVQFFADLVLANLFWTFVLVALSFYVVGGNFKKVIYGTIVIALTIFVAVDFGTGLGIPIFVGGFLLINYIVKLSSLILVTSRPNLKGKIVYVNEISAIVVVIVYLVFLAGA